MPAPETEQSDFADGVHVEVIGGTNSGRRGVIQGGPGRHGPDRTWLVKFENGERWQVLEADLRVYAIADEMAEANPLFDRVPFGSYAELAAKAQAWLEENSSEATNMAIVSIALSLARIAQAFDSPRSVPQHYLAGKPGPAPVAEGEEFAAGPETEPRQAIEFPRPDELNEALKRLAAIAYGDPDAIWTSVTVLVDTALSVAESRGRGEQRQ